eukprot:scaffold219717_cov31-Tisochrysis_lutea.AAC.2
MASGPRPSPARALRPSLRRKHESKNWLCSPCAPPIEMLIGKLLEAVTRSEELQRTTPTGRGAGSSAPQASMAKSHGCDRCTLPPSCNISTRCSTQARIST